MENSEHTRYNVAKAMQDKQASYGITVRAIGENSKNAKPKLGERC